MAEERSNEELAQGSRSFSAKKRQETRSWSGRFTFKLLLLLQPMRARVRPVYGPCTHTTASVHPYYGLRAAYHTQTITTYVALVVLGRRVGLRAHP